MGLRLSFLLLAIVLVPGVLTAADGDAGHGTISVVGVGEAAREPDLAMAHLTVLTRHASLSEALSQNSERTERLLASLREHGVAGSDLRTSRFHAGEHHDRRKEVVQYEVLHTVAVTLRDLDKAGAILTEALQHASRIQSMSLGNSAPERLARDARLRALDNAHERARQYAERAGVPLGPVLSISEHLSPRRPKFADFLSSAKADDGVPSMPIARGEIKARAHIRVVFAIGSR